MRRLTYSICDFVGGGPFFTKSTLEWCGERPRGSSEGGIPSSLNRLLGGAIQTHQYQFAPPSARLRERGMPPLRPTPSPNLGEEICNASAMIRSPKWSFLRKRSLVAWSSWLWTASSTIAQWRRARDLTVFGLSAGPRFDSGRNPVNSNQYGLKQIDPQARVQNYCFQ